MIGRILALTLALSATVVVSWIGIRGLGVFTGPGPFLDPSWATISVRTNPRPAPG